MIGRGACALVLLLTTGACSGTSPRQKPEPQASAYPAVFGDPATRPGPGTHRELCSRWERTGPPRTVSVNLPDRFVERSKGREGCTFEARIGNGVQIDLHPGSSLASFLRQDIEPNVDVGGDVSFSNVEYAAGVPVFGDVRGEHLSYEAYLDGVQTDTHVVQARGVRMSWDAVIDRWALERSEFEAATASLAVAAVDEDLCSHADGRRRQSVRFARPEAAVESYRYGFPECPRDLPTASRMPPDTHRLTIRLLETRALADVRDQVAGKPGVRRLTYAPSAAGFAGERAERLAWEAPARHWTIRTVVLQQDGVRLTWRAPVENWAEDAVALEQLRRSLVLGSEPRPSTSRAGDS
jgi:hypothetical protein